MGIRNPRVNCPNCGGLIHTQPKGIGKVMIRRSMNSMMQTGKACQHCGVALTGKVKLGRKAELAQDPEE